MDIRSAAELGEIAQGRRIHSLVHLAAAGTVLAPLKAVPGLFDVSVDGALNVLKVFQPGRVIYGSSCAVYGNSRPEGGRAGWEDVHPISVYGLSKAATEKVLEQWARESGSVAVLLRLGNVVGANCGGLIPYLVRHATKYPDGNVAAAMRGGGKIARDYVPVDFVTRVMQLALQSNFEPGTSTVFNVGAGRTMTNGDIADILREWLAPIGYRLRVEFQPNPEHGESMCSRLQTDVTESRFNFIPPSVDEVRQAVRAGAKSYLEQFQAAAAVAGQLSVSTK